MVETVQVEGALHAIVETLQTMLILLPGVLNSVVGHKHVVNALLGMRAEEMQMPNFITPMDQMM